MTKYYMYALAFKILSSTELTRCMYRALGNILGTKRRASEKIRPYYIERVNNMLKASKSMERQITAII